VQSARLVQIRNCAPELRHLIGGDYGENARDFSRFFASYCRYSSVGAGAPYKGYVQHSRQLNVFDV
jgi:hypothetical protein